MNGTVVNCPTFVSVEGRPDWLHQAVHTPDWLCRNVFERLDLANFRGRRQLIAEIDGFVASHNYGYVVLLGEAGVGKSTLAAHLMWTRGYPAYFVRPGERDPVAGRKSLAAQIIMGWGLERQLAPGSLFPVAAENPRWLADVLDAAARERDRVRPGRPLILVVDGLDEAERDRPAVDTGIPLGLPVPESLPAGVFIIATSRHGIPLDPLADRARVGWTEIPVESADNLADMRDYLTARVIGTGADRALHDALARHDVAAEFFVETLLARCKGVWIYLRYVLDEIREGIRSPADVASLPTGLRGYYNQQIRRWAGDTTPAEPDRWDRLRLPALATLAALQRPAGADEVAAIIGPHADPKEIGAWLNGPARPFLDANLDPPGRPTYLVRHQSFRDLFVKAPADHTDAGLGEELSRAGRTAHQAITRWLIPVDRDGRPDWDRADGYARLMLAEHAAAAGYLDELMRIAGFPLTCLPWRILRHRHELTTPAGLAAAAALEAATNDWGDDGLWWLHVWARKTRADALAESVVRRAHWPWVVETGFWSGTTHRTLAGHTGRVGSVAVLPRAGGNDWIVSASDDGTVRLWDPDTAEEARQFTGHGDWWQSVAVLTRPDRRHWVVLGNQRALVRAWDPDTGAEHDLRPARLVADGRPAHLLNRPDGSFWFACPAADGTVEIRDLETGREILTLTASPGRLGPVALVVRTDRRHRIAAVCGSSVYLWDVGSGARIGELTGVLGEVESIAVVPRPDDQHWIVTAGSDRSIQVWDCRTGAHLRDLRGHTGRVWSVAVLPNPDGRHRIVSGSTDRTVRVWDPETGDQVQRFTGHSDWVQSVAVLAGSGGRHRIVSGSADRTVRIWSPHTQLPGLAGHTAQVESLAVLPRWDGGHWLVSGSADGTVRMWDPVTGEQVHQLDGHPGGVGAIAVMPRHDDFHWIVSAGADAVVRVWEADSGVLIQELRGHSSWVQAVAVMSQIDGRPWIVTGGSDRTMRLREAETGEYARRGLTNTISGVESLAIVPRPDGRPWIAVGGYAGTIDLRNPVDGTWEGALEGHRSRVCSIVVLPRPDGTHRLVSGGDDGTIRIWDPSLCVEVARMTGHAGGVRSVALLPRPDGTHWLVSGGDDASVRIWNPDSGVQIARFTGHVGGARSVTVLPRPNGRYWIASGGADATVLVWRPSDDDPE
ncbi:AAA family ATPase [Actinoplanes sp. NPDC049118]|uniref:AAA family ATPase n=1 Tax=Actinoplanes sp. NPDC049118 TaxID=3155769 RepID=UPI0034072FC9